MTSAIELWPDVLIDRRRFLLGLTAAASGVVAVPAPLAFAANEIGLFAAPPALVLHNVHTAERLTLDHTDGGYYPPETLGSVRRFLRDHHDGTLHDIDPRLLDTLFSIMQLVGHKGAIQVLSAYRSPNTNAMLRRINEGVAAHSFHMQGKAVDFWIPGLPLTELHKAAVSLKAGGVGFYPYNNFVHVDVGPVRYWGGMGMSRGPSRVTEFWEARARSLGEPRRYGGLTPYQVRLLERRRRALSFEGRSRRHK
ncbi:MAG: DUF882 domain-containing protein [Azospirillum sp.]|nr:DUF882 domain-containing protein [Azospirillum sp.]